MASHLQNFGSAARRSFHDPVSVSVQNKLHRFRRRPVDDDAKTGVFLEDARGGLVPEVPDEWAAGSGTHEPARIAGVIFARPTSSDVRQMTAPLQSVLVSPTALATPVRHDLVFALVRRIAMQRGLEEAAYVLSRALRDLVGGVRAYCHFVDPNGGTLWNLADPSLGVDILRVESLITLAASTDSVVTIDRAADHPHFVAAINDPYGSEAGDQAIVVQPIMAAGRLIGVMTVVRPPRQTSFGIREVAMLSALAANVAPILFHFLVERERNQRRTENARAGMFRDEAVASYQSQGKLGNLVRSIPSCLRRCYQAVAAIAVLAVLFAAFVPVNHYSSGSAVVSWEGTPITAPYAGTVLTVSVDSGQQVRKGQVLAELFSAEEKAAYVELQEQFDQNVATLLRDPTDETVRHSLREIGAKRNRAKSRLEERRIRAPRDGRVADVRIRPGQNLVAGDSILRLVDEDVSLIVVAVLPGADRPQISVGMDLRFALSGYNIGALVAEIEWVSTEVVGPREARRYLGQQIADSMKIGGPVVLVRARLTAATFEEGGRSLVLHDGMHGTAEVRISRESLLVSLISGD